MSGSVIPLRNHTPALAAYRQAEAAKRQAAADVYAEALKALNAAEEACSAVAEVDLPPGVRDLARRLADTMAESANGMAKIMGTVG